MHVFSVSKSVHIHSVQFSSVAQSCPTLCDHMNWSTPGLPVHQQLPESTQTHVHQVGDAIQPSHPLSSPSPPAPKPSRHHGLFKWVSSSHQGAKVLECQLQHQSFQWAPRTDLLQDGRAGSNELNTIKLLGWLKKKKKICSVLSKSVQTFVEFLACFYDKIIDAIRSKTQVFLLRYSLVFPRNGQEITNSKCYKMCYLKTNMELFTTALEWQWWGLIMEFTRV